MARTKNQSYRRNDELETRAESSRALETEPDDDRIVSLGAADPTLLLDPGPDDDSLLTLQPDHRSQAIWLGLLQHDILEARHGTMKKWAVDNPAREDNFFPRDPRLEPYLVRTGFWGWTLVEGIVCDWAHLTALVERWRPETHTFHLRDGEMTILLEDVGLLTGLPIEGLAVTGTDATSDNWEGLCISCFGRDLPRHNKRRSCVLRTELIRLFRVIPEGADDLTLERHFRAYLLYMIGTTLFPDSTGNLISLHWLQLIQDLDAVRNYSWGSAALAFLYRSLCTAATGKKNDLTGPVVIVQLWAWERMHLGRPGVKYSMPLVEGSLANPDRRPPVGYR